MKYKRSALALLLICACWLVPVAIPASASARARYHLTVGIGDSGYWIWSVPNLLASTFYGEAALRRGFRWTTLSGVALHLIVSVVAGLLFGSAVNGIAGRGRVMTLGFAAGVGRIFSARD